MCPAGIIVVFQLVVLWQPEQSPVCCCAVPVGPEDTLHELTRWADEVVCLAVPAYFPAVGMFYERFDQVEDAEVIGILQRAKRGK